MKMTDLYSLESILKRIRTLNGELAELPSGVAILHMDAAVAALEHHIMQQAKPERLAIGRPLVQGHLF